MAGKSKIKGTPKADIGLAIILIVICGLVLWQSSQIPPTPFDLLGSATAPQALSVLITIICVVVIVRAVGNLKQSEGPPRDLGFDLRPWDTIGLFALTVVYVGALAFRTTSFGVASTVFLSLTIGLLTRFPPRLFAVILIVSFVVSFGCQFAFTRIFFVDLPT